MRKLRILGLMCVFILTSMACTSTTAIYLSDNPSRPMVHWPLVRIYENADQVEGDYEEIALLVTTWSAGSLNALQEKKMWKSMKKKASKIGANAIILDGKSKSASASKIVGSILRVNASREGKALAIYVYPERK